MKKKRVFIVICVFLIFISTGVIYLNKVFLPNKIQSVLIQTIEKQTQKKVSLDSLQFNIFKGIILRNLKIFDDQSSIIEAEEISCRVLILPLFKKNIIIPSITIKSPAIFIERRKDSSFNLLDFMPREETKPKKQMFNILVSGVRIINGHIDYQDNTFAVPFRKSLDKINSTASLSLPDRIKIELKSEIPNNPITYLYASGGFQIPDKSLSAVIDVKNLQPKEFFPYYKNTGISDIRGMLNSQINITFKNNTLSAEIKIQNKELSVSKEQTYINLNSELTTNFTFDIESSQMNLSCNTKITNNDILTLPNSVKIQPQGELLFNIQANLLSQEKPKLDGSFDFINTTVQLEQVPVIFKDISGKIYFDLNQINWSDLKFVYQDTYYTTTGKMTNFNAPEIQLMLSSKDISLQSNLTCIEKLITIKQTSGRYLDSELLSLKGTIDTQSPLSINSDLNTELKIKLKDVKNLKDIPAIKKDIMERLEQINPSGTVSIAIDLEGNIKDISSCAIQAELNSSSLSLYGLNFTDLSLNYTQLNRKAQIPEFQLSLYGGKINAQAGIDLVNSQNLPFWMNADVKDIKIDKLILDTPLKSKDISGIIQSQIKIDGKTADLSSLKGNGTILLTEGKLWELNLLKGISELLFSQDLVNITFNEGRCEFIIKDQFISTDNLILKSNFINLDGIVRIGFDGSINSSGNIELVEKFLPVPVKEEYKEIASAVLGQTGRFGVITISGTFKKPKFEFKPVVIDVIKEIKDTLENTIKDTLKTIFN